MEKIKRENLKKKDISKNISLKSGVSLSFASRFLDDVIVTLISGLKINGKLKINKFGSFKTRLKKKRIGRNPKNNQTYEIDSRKTVSFKASDFLKNKINNE